MLSVYDYDSNQLVILRNDIDEYVQGEAYDIEYESNIDSTKEIKMKMPLYVSVDGVQSENHRWDYTYNELLVKYVDDESVTDWFFIKKVSDTFSDNGELVRGIELKHISYRLNKKGLDKVINETSTPTYLMTTILEGTGWSVGTISASLLAVVRTLDIPDAVNTLEHLQQLAEKYEAFLRFNGDKTVDLLTSIGSDIGLRISIGKNLKALKKETDSEIITRLIMIGGNDTNDTLVTMAASNPTGENYIDNFSYYITTGLMPAAKQALISPYNVDILAVNTNISNTQALLTADTATLLTKQASLETKKINLASIIQLIAEDTLQLDTNVAGTAKYIALQAEIVNYNGQKSTLEGEISTLEGEITALQGNISGYNSTIAGYLVTKQGIIDVFSAAMSDFLHIGRIDDSNYVDSASLYADATVILARISQPQVEYEIDFLDLHTLSDYTLDKVHIGDTMYLVHSDFNINTTVIITSLSRCLDKPWDTAKIEVANYTSLFTDIFKSISQITNISLQNKEYWRISESALKLDGTINSTALQNTFNAGAFSLINGSDDSVATGSDGIVSTSVNTSTYKLRIDGGNLMVSIDDGATWKPLITVYHDAIYGDKIGFNFYYARGGVLDISQINIKGDTDFFWNSLGLFAVDSASPTTNYVKLNKDGLSATQDGGATTTFNLSADGSLTIGSASGSDVAATVSGTVNYRTTGVPTNNPTPSGVAVTANTNATINIKLDWSAYTQGAKQADMILLFWKKGASPLGSPAVTDSCLAFNVNTSGAAYHIFEGVNPADNFSFGVAAARRTENGLEIGVIQSPTATPDWQDVTSGTPNFTANLNGTAASTVVTQASNSVQQNTAYNKVKISTAEGIQVFDAGNNERLKLGDLGSSEFGFYTKDSAGVKKVEIRDDGTIKAQDGYFTGELYVSHLTSEYKGIVGTTIDTTYYVDNVSSYYSTAFGSNGDLRFMSVFQGITGNSISITYTAGGGLSIGVSGTDITVTYVAGVTTANQVLAAIEASSGASGLVYVDLASGSDGTGLVGALAKTNLANYSQGDDTNGDGSVGNPFASTAYALSLLPKTINHVITIILTDGTNEVGGIEVSGFNGTGSILISANTYSKYYYIYVHDIICDIAFSSGKIVGYQTVDGSTNAFTLINALGENIISQMSMYQVPTGGTPTDRGIYVSNSWANIQQCVIKSHYVGIYAENGARILSFSNSGLNTTYGLGVYGASKLGKSSIQPTGSTANENTFTGGEIS